MRIIIFLHVVLLGIYCVLFSDMRMVSAQPNPVSEISYPRLYVKTVSNSETQGTNTIDNNYRSLQEEERNEGSEMVSESTQEDIYNYSPDIGTENLFEGDMQEYPTNLPKSPFQVGYKNGLYLKTADDRFSLNAGLRFQLRYEIDDFQDKKDTSALTIRRGRVKLTGNAYGDLMTYFLQVDAHSTGKQSEISTLELIDYYTDINVIPFTKIRLGQGRVPSNRQWITPDSKLQMIDFSVASNEFNLGRHLGIMAHNKYFNKKLKCNLGIYSGNYILFNRDFRNNDELLGIFRASYYPFGEFGYSESDVKFSDSPLFHISGSISFDRKNDVSRNLEKLGNVRDDNVENTMFVEEMGFKYRGFSILEEFYWRNGEFSDEDITDLGCFVQAGYFVLPKKLETTLRFSVIDFDDDLENEITIEETVGINYFLSGHRYKAQFNAVRINRETVHHENTDYKFILQIQFAL